MSQAGLAEINEPGLAQLVDQDVLGLDVLVNNATAVQIRRRFRQLGHQCRGPPSCGPALRGVLCQVEAGDVFHHQVRSTLINVEIDDLHQPRMIELGQQSSLGREEIARNRPGAMGRR